MSNSLTRWTLLFYAIGRNKPFSHHVGPQQNGCFTRQKGHVKRPFGEKYLAKTDCIGELNDTAGRALLMSPRWTHETCGDCTCRLHPRQRTFSKPTRIHRRVIKRRNRTVVQNG